jgi:hypothetical protein
MLHGYQEPTVELMNPALPVGGHHLVIYGQGSIQRLLIHTHELHGHLGAGGDLLAGGSHLTPGG